MPDQLTELFAAYATTLTPSTPGDFSDVRKVARRHQRRRTTGTALACAAVVAIVIPLAATMAGNGNPAPQGPSPAPSLSTSAGPSPTTRPAPIGPSTVPAVVTPSPILSESSSSIAVSASPSAAATFAAGPPPALPLLVVSGKDNKLELVTGGIGVAVGSASQELQAPPINTPSGIVLQDGNQVDLLTSDHLMVRLSGNASVLHSAVSADGRYVAWGEQVIGAKGAVSGSYFLYDLAHRRTVHHVTSSREGGAVGLLDDGRVVMWTGDGGDTGVQLWQPATGAITTLPSKYLGASVAGPHTLVLFESDNDCASVVEDTRTSRQLRLSGCQVLGLESPDGKRVLSVDGSTDLSLRLPGLLDRVTGKHDPRLALLLKAAGTRSADGVWLDDQHVLLSAVSQIRGSRKLEALAFTCAVPRAGKPSCTVSKDFGPAASVGSNGNLFPRPEAYVVHSSLKP